MQIQRGKYRNRLGTQLKLGYVTLPPLGSVTIDPEIQADMDGERWNKTSAAIRISIERGWLTYEGEDALQLGEAGLRVQEAPIEDEDEDTSETNPYLRIDPQDIVGFLGQNYQTLRKQLRKITDYRLLGKYFTEAGRLGKSEAVLRAIEVRMQELQASAMREEQTRKQKNVNELMNKGAKT